ncbi:phenylacetate--CoA ligase family protein [Calidifontibacillus oryziterrae]|uniref:phenylacetate--CoA ligase family protein n=1 Tax=Calidifontibacillus oryziterrae TaxID=1191699 RepID=UPI0002F2419F|nr:AMP-binding protein [Calidifontibacillus oryziterrae]
MIKLQNLLQRAYENADGFRKRMSETGITLEDIHSIDDLYKLPILKKEDLPELQQNVSPFGGFTTIPANQTARIFMSPGPIYDPQAIEEDNWRFAEALAVAGFNNEDIVQNTFSYHLSPAGFMFDSALRSLGATVIPAGTGNRDLQIQVMKDLRVTGYVGTPSFLALLLDAAEEKGWSVGNEIKLQKAFFTAEMVTAEIRERCNKGKIAVYEGYGTADCGLIAFDDKNGPGLKISKSVIVQICDPATGEPVTDSEGEVVVTVYDHFYPLIRFGTGDLSRWVDGYVGERIAGVLGRVSDGVKVKGMFVREKQLTTLMNELGFPNYQAVVTRVKNQDQIEIFIEAKEIIGEEQIVELVAKIKDVIIVTPVVTVSYDRKLAEAEKRLVDERTWDTAKK